MPLSETPDQQAWREFNEMKCAVCGQHKERFTGFCKDCYFKLDRDMRNALYNRFGNGFETAYYEAKEFLLGEKKANG